MAFLPNHSQPGRFLHGFLDTWLLFLHDHKKAKNATVSFPKVKGGCGCHWIITCQINWFILPSECLTAQWPAGIISYNLTLYLTGSCPTHSPGPAQVRFLMNQMSRSEIHFSKYHPPIPSACSVPLLDSWLYHLPEIDEKQKENLLWSDRPVCWLPNHLLCLTWHFLIGHTHAWKLTKWVISLASNMRSTDICEIRKPMLPFCRHLVALVLKPDR